MSVVVINPPAAVVSPADARAAGVFTADDSDVFVAALLAAAQGTIDGPTGWLGRAIGLQTLELTSRPWSGSDCIDLRGSIGLPYPPVRKIVSITAGAGASMVDPAGYALYDGRVTFLSAPAWGYPVRVRYQAGYGQVDSIDEPLPPPIKHAIMLMAAQLKTILPASEGDIVKEDITGVGSTVYATAKASEDTLRTTAERLLSTFRVFL